MRELNVKELSPVSQEIIRRLMAGQPPRVILDNVKGAKRETIAYFRVRLGIQPFPRGNFGPSLLSPVSQEITRRLKAGEPPRVILKNVKGAKRATIGYHRLRLGVRPFQTGRPPFSRVKKQKLVARQIVRRLKNGETPGMIRRHVKGASFSAIYYYRIQLGIPPFRPDARVKKNWNKARRLRGKKPTCSRPSLF